MLKSLLIGVAFTASLLAAPYLNNLFVKDKEMTTKPHTTVYDLTPISDEKEDDEKPEIPKEKKETSGPVESTIAFNAITVTTDDVVEDLVTSDELLKLQPGETTQDGDPNNWGIPGNGDDDYKTVIGDDDEVHGFYGIAQPPKYPGGDEAMWEFLGSNLEYPEHARQIHQEGKVYVTFVIDQFGNVTKVAIPRPIGAGLDEEAMRVVQMMPRWEPGRQNGRPVKVGFQLPIIFRLD